jgi:hypothetical protein
LDNAKGHSHGVVEQHLVGATLEKRFSSMAIPNKPIPSRNIQSVGEGNFLISDTAYHVTALPSRSVIRKCIGNIKTGLHPVLLVPHEQLERAKFLAHEEETDDQVSIMSIENFVALNIIELAAEDSKDFYSVLKEIVQIYNKRLLEVETDASLQIQIR